MNKKLLIIDIASIVLWVVLAVLDFIIAATNDDSVIWTIAFSVLGVLILYICWMDATRLYRRIRPKPHTWTR